MLDREMVGLMDHCMADGDIRTALICTDGLDFIQFTDHEALRQMSASLTRWGNFSSTNQNICIFTLPNLELDSLRRLSERAPGWNFLMNRMFRGDQPGKNMFCVGIPRQDEVKNLLNHWRIKKSLAMDWNLFDDAVVAITRKINNENMGLKDLSARVMECPDLGRETLAMLSGHTEKRSALERFGEVKGWETVQEWLVKVIAVKREQSSATAHHTHTSATREKSGNFTGENSSALGNAPKGRGGDSVFRLMPDNRWALERENIGALVRENSGRLVKESPGALVRESPGGVGRENPGRLVRENLHLVLKGNPGTGKTTIAGGLGEIFLESGLLELGHVVKASREDLVAGYVGQTAIRTATKIREAMGGILFVDEAYRLTREGENDFGREAVETILEAMENHRGEFSVIAAGYPDRMEKFLDANPGIRSRFGVKNILTIPDYGPELLEHIYKLTCRTNGRYLDAKLGQVLPDIISSCYVNRDPDSFGNARDMISLYSEMDGNRAVRVAGFRGDETAGFKMDDNCEGMMADRREHTETFFTLTLEDLPQRLHSSLTPVPDQVGQVDQMDVPLAKLDSLIGLKSVKTMVRTAINRVKIEKMRCPDAVVAPGHYIFTGNPGTGKTTVARLMGEMFRSMGLLKKGHLREVGRGDLVGEYSGHTAPKTSVVLEESLDGVLFIDEAYQLVQDSRDSFGREALDTILAFMENHNDRLSIICAGYPAPMNFFINENPGLPSRLAATIEFHNYSAREMFEIFTLMATERKLFFSRDLEVTLMDVFKDMESRACSTFGNGREVRNLLETMCSNQANRLVSKLESIGLEPGERSALFELKCRDISA